MVGSCELLVWSVPCISKSSDSRDAATISCSQFANILIMPPRCQLLSGQFRTHNVVVRASQSTSRTYATSEPPPVVKNPLRRRKGGDLGSHLPVHIIPSDAYIPPYPYGDHALFKQANRGLYGEQMIQFGNNVSKKTETKTRRYWKPNVLSKSLYSVALKKRIKLRITSNVLKTMDREGGLDEYLLKDNEHRLKELGPLGWALRWTLMQRPEVIDRMRAQAAALGVDQATIDAQWPTRQLLAEQRATQNGFVRAADLIGEEGAEEDVEEYTPYTEEERRAMNSAGKEYEQAVNAAERYLARGSVDSEEAGIKLAFIRAKERKEASKSNQEHFANKLNEQFSAEDIAATRTKFDLPAQLNDAKVRKIAYNQWRRQEVEKAGSYEAWRAQIDAEKAAQVKANLASAGGILSETERKTAFSTLIAEAETAATNTSLSPSRRMTLENAIAKADRVIKAKAAGGKEAYVEAVMEERQASIPKTLKDVVRKAKVKGEDAWAALVQSSNKGTENRARA
jgi:large subunit ribosomal protein L28